MPSYGRRVIGAGRGAVQENSIYITGATPNIIGPTPPPPHYMLRI